MKRLFFAVLSVCFVTSCSFAQEEAITAPAVTPIAPVTVTVTLKGDIIDNKCMEANKAALAEFIETHTKECALMCASSGYSIVSEDKIYAFDAPSNAKIEEFLKTSDGRLQVEITALQTDDKLSLISIVNQ